MLYRELGRTGLKVSQLGFGTMRLPMVGEGENQKVDRELAIPMLHRAFEAGVNYVDSAIFYCHNDSECALGDALKGWREKIVVSTKNTYYGEDEKEWWKLLEQSLTRLQIDFIDLYCHHGINWKVYQESVEPRVSKWMQKAKDQGLIKHICTSFHDNAEALINIVKTGYPSVITLQYNILNRELEEGIALAHEKGMGVVVMGPVGGGSLGVPSEVLETMIDGVDRTPALALRFVLANPNVTVALSGMSTMGQVEENIATGSDEASLSEEDVKAINEHLIRMKKMAELYCTACKYCMPCPQEVNIPSIFGKYTLGKVYGLWETAQKGYEELGVHEWDKGNRADACVECGECEEKCPQKIPIMQQLKQAHEELTKK